MSKCQVFRKEPLRTPLESVSRNSNSPATVAEDYRRPKSRSARTLHRSSDDFDARPLYDRRSDDSDGPPPLAVLSISLLCPGAVRAQSVDRLIEQGVSLREDGRDLEALELFQRAYRRSKSVRAPAQIALAHQALGRWIEAERHLFGGPRQRRCVGRSTATTPDESASYHPQPTRPPRGPRLSRGRDGARRGATPTPFEHDMENSRSRVALSPTETSLEFLAAPDSQETKPEPDDAWWTEAAHAPSGLLTNVNARRTQKWSIDATVRIKAQDKKGREQLLRYACRPPFAQEQFQVLDEERIRFQLRSPMPSGQEEIVFHPIALMQKLAWLVPPPHQHQIRYAGVLAPAARLRPSVVPAGRVAIQGVWFAERDFVPIEPVQYRQSWAVLLARVYDVNAQACMNCSGILRPVGAVTPPQAEEWIRRQRILPLGSRAPPTRQLALAF